MRVKKTRNIKSRDQQNDLVIRGFCYIRPRYNEVPLYKEACYKHRGNFQSLIFPQNVGNYFQVKCQFIFSFRIADMNYAHMILYAVEVPCHFQQGSPVFP